MTIDELDSSIKKVNEYLQKNQLANAGALLDSIAKKSPNNVDILNLTGVLNLKAGDYENAICAFKKYLLSYPENVFVLNNLAVAYQKAENFTEAKSALKKAIKLDNNYVNSYMNLLMLNHDL